MKKKEKVQVFKVKLNTIFNEKARTAYEVVLWDDITGKNYWQFKTKKKAEKFAQELREVYENK